MYSGRIYENTRSTGGGVELNGADFYLYGGEITGNSATQGGGGIFSRITSGIKNQQNNIYAYGGAIYGNTTPNAVSGPDVYLYHSNTSPNYPNQLFLGNDEYDTDPVIGQVNPTTGLAEGGLYNEFASAANIIVSGNLGQSALVVIQKLKYFDTPALLNKELSIASFSNDLDTRHEITPQDCEAFRVEPLPGWTIEPSEDNKNVVLCGGLQQRIDEALKEDSGTSESPVELQLPAGYLSTGLATINLPANKHLRLVGAAGKERSVLLRAPGNDAFAESLFQVRPGATLVLDNVVLDGNREGGHREVCGPLVMVGDSTVTELVATLEINNKTILRNNANYAKDHFTAGGGLHITQNAYVYMTDGEISGNLAGRHSSHSGGSTNDYSGGGVNLRGVLNMSGGVITGNKNAVSPVNKQVPPGDGIFIAGVGSLRLVGSPKIGTSDSDNHVFDAATSSTSFNVWIYDPGLKKDARVNVYATFYVDNLIYVANKRKFADSIFPTDDPEDEGYTLHPTVPLSDNEAARFFNVFDQQIGVVYNYPYQEVTSDWRKAFTYVVFDKRETKPDPPQAPTLTGFAGSQMANLTVTPNAKDTKYVTEYRLYWDEGKGGSAVLKDQAATGAFAVSGLEDGTTYKFWGAVVTRGGESDMSDPIVLTPEAQHTPAASVRIAAERTSLANGESTALAASVFPAEAAQEVSWSSSDTSVVTVAQNGLLGGTATAVSPGTAYITAVSADGRAASSISITVEAPEQPHRELAFAYNSKNMGAGYSLTLGFKSLNGTIDSMDDLFFTLRDPTTSAPPAVPTSLQTYSNTTTAATTLNDRLSELYEEPVVIFEELLGYAVFPELTLYFGAYDGGYPRLFIITNGDVEGRYYLRMGFAADETVWDELLLNISLDLNPSTNPEDYADILIDKAAVPFYTFKPAIEYNALITLLPDRDDPDGKLPPSLDGAKVQFTEKYDAYNKLFEFWVLDDSLIGVVAKPGATFSQSSYKGQLEVITGDHLDAGSFTFEPVGLLTLKIDRSKPKLIAESINVDTFFASTDERVQPIAIRHDSVLAIRTTSDKTLADKNRALADWLALKNGETAVSIGGTGLEVNTAEVLAPNPSNLKTAKKSGKLYLEVLLDGWGVDIDPANAENWVPVTVSVSRKHTVPALKMVKGSAQIYGATGAAITMAIAPKSSKNTLAGLGVQGASIANDSPLKMFEVVAGTVNLATGEFVLRATGTPESGTVKLDIEMANSNYVIPLQFKIKAVKAGGKVSLKPDKKTITLNPNIATGDTRTLTINPSVPGFDLSQYTLTPVWQGAAPGQDEIAVKVLNNQLTFHIDGGKVPARSSYKLKLTYAGLYTGKKGPVDVSTTVTVKALALGSKNMPSATLAPKGSVDLTTGTPATVKLNFKNYEGTLHEGALPNLKLTLKGDDGADAAAGRPAYIDRFIITPLGGNTWLLRPKPREHLPAGTYKLEMLPTKINAINDPISYKAVNFKVAASKPVAALSVSQVSLSGKDGISRAYFEIITPHGGVPISDVQIKVKNESSNPFKIVKVGANRYYVTFKSNSDISTADQLRRRAKKSTTLTLNLYIDSCDTPVTTLKLKVLKQ